MENDLQLRADARIQCDQLARTYRDFHEKRSGTFSERFYLCRLSDMLFLFSAFFSADINSLDNRGKQIEKVSHFMRQKKPGQRTVSWYSILSVNRTLSCVGEGKRKEREKKDRCLNTYIICFPGSRSLRDTGIILHCHPNPITSDDNSRATSPCTFQIKNKK